MCADWRDVSYEGTRGSISTVLRPKLKCSFPSFREAVSERDLIASAKRRGVSVSRRWRERSTVANVRTDQNRVLPWKNFPLQKHPSMCANQEVEQRSCKPGCTEIQAGCKSWKYEAIRSVLSKTKRYRKSRKTGEKGERERRRENSPMRRGGREKVKNTKLFGSGQNW